MENKLEFVSYDGEYPNLCSGILILRLNGEDIVFPKYSLSSGGGVWFENDYKEEHVEDGEWSIKEFPENFPVSLCQQATDLVNDNVPHGCCGGCL